MIFIRLLVGVILLGLAGCSKPDFICSNSDFSFPEDIKGTWSGLAHMEEQTWLVELHFAQNPENGCFDVRVSFPDGGIFYFSPESYSRDANSLAFGIPSTSWQLVFNYDLEKNEISGAWNHLERDLNAPFTLTRISEQAPFLKTEDIVFQSPDGASLAGTLVLPDGEGPFPAVVWTHGSGPDTRETMAYLSRAQLAASLGMAVLIYDKRGAGESTGEAPWELSNLIMDAASAVEVLRNHPGIKKDQIGIAGYSQGGWVAPYIAGNDENIAFIIVGSAPGITPAEQNIYSMITRFESEFGSEVTSKAVTGLRQVYDYYRTGEGYQEVQALVDAEESQVWSQTRLFKQLLFTQDGNIAKGVEPGSYESMFIDPLPYWRNIKVPVFTVWGGIDHNVPAFKSQKLIEEALRKNGNSQVTSFVVEGGGHGIELKNPNDGHYYWFRLHPDYIPALTSFIEEQVNK